MCNVCILLNTVVNKQDINIRESGNQNLLTSRMCSWVLASYLLLYFEESSTVPLLRPHVTVGAGSPLTIALKRAFLPVKSKIAVTTLLLPVVMPLRICFPHRMWYLPSWTVVAIGFRVKSGVDFPSGKRSTCWVMITPATLDLFLIATG